MNAKQKLLSVFLLSLMVLGGGGYLYVKLLTSKHEIYLWNRTDQPEKMPVKSSPTFTTTPLRGTAKAIREGEFRLYSEDVEEVDYYNEESVARRGIAPSIVSGGTLQQANYGMGYKNSNSKINQTGGGGGVLAYGGSAASSTSSAGSINSNYNSTYSIPTVFAPSNGGGDIGGVVLADPNNNDNDVNFLPLGDGLFPLLLFGLLYLVIIERKLRVKG